MNCAVHKETPAVAYCRTCGTALCTACKRDVRGVIYCENCLAQRLHDVMPPAGAPGAVPPGSAGATPVMMVPSGPNPGLAAVLAAFFPFGVGAVYCAQYAKGLAHMIIFALLVWGASTDAGPGGGALFGIAIAFFYVYQIVDAYRSAKALQMGHPAPDPFGLGQIVGTSGNVKISNVPTGALVLIALGVLFLLSNLGLFRFHVFTGLIIPILLIGLGVWSFVRRFGMAGEPAAGCCCPHCRARGLMGPAILVTIGGLWLLAEVHGPSFGRTWPIILLVIGLIKVLQSNAPTTGHTELPPPPSGGAQAPPPSSPAGGEVGREVGNV